MRPATALYLCIALLWAIFLASAITLLGPTSDAAKTYRLGTFSTRAVQLIRDLQQEQILSLDSASPAQSDASRDSLQAQFDVTGVQVIGYRTARDRFNEVRFGTGISEALKAADAALNRLDEVRSDIFSNKISQGYVLDFYSGLLSDLTVPVIAIGKLDEFAPEKAGRHEEIARLAEVGKLAAREAALGIVLATGGNLNPDLMSEWQSFPKRYEVLLAEYGGTQNSPASAFLTSIRSPMKTKEAARLLGRLRNGGSRIADEAFRAGLLKSLSQQLRSLDELTITRLVQLDADARRVTRHNGYLITALTVLAGLATLAVIHRHHANSTRPAFIVLLLVFNLALTLWALTTGPEIFSHEMGPLETLQALAISIAFVLFWREAASQTGPSRTAAVVLTAACFLMFFREADFRLLDAPDWIVRTTSGPVRRAMFLFLALIITGYAVARRDHVRKLARQGMSLSAWPLFAWFTLLPMGEVVEAVAHLTRKDDLPGYWAGGPFFEELLELNAYIALFFAACVFRSIFPSGETAAGCHSGENAPAPSSGKASRKAPRRRHSARAADVKAGKANGRPATTSRR